MLLLRLHLAPGTADAVDCAAQVRAFARQAQPVLDVRRVAVSARAALAYAYLQAPHEDAAMAAGVAQAFAASHAWCGSAGGCWLESVFDVPGASAGEPARFHYVVETDPEDGWFDEIARWYDDEHMPGLASVAGCIHASRYLNRAGAGPVSFACYDLVSEDTLGSPDWLAVRHTAWSDRARPHFTNTRRTMFQVA
ncbi:MAG: hypothetical protein KA795_17230 [Burkholderiaceae bacterium]|nr:hypothetical protein [Burkholderiaceae bacterium]